MRCSGQSCSASVGDDDISAVLGPGQVEPKLDDYLLPSAAAKHPGERTPTLVVRLGQLNSVRPDWSTGVT